MKEKKRTLREIAKEIEKNLDKKTTIMEYYLEGLRNIDSITDSWNCISGYFLVVGILEYSRYFLSKDLREELIEILVDYLKGDQK